MLTEHKLFPIPNYGSAMSPFFTTLALWFAGLVIVSIFGVDIQDLEGTYKSYQIYVGRYLNFFCIGILQSIIISVVETPTTKVASPKPYGLKGGILA
ncbi:hypothetical protein V7068_10015 [Bacillus sp. JJ634]